MHFPCSYQLSGKDPLISVNRVSESLSLVEFRPTECNISAKILEPTVHFHETVSGGAIKVKSNLLSDGFVVVLQNCTIDPNPVLMNQALQGVANRLRSTCAQCEDFNPKLDYT